MQGSCWNKATEILCRKLSQQNKKDHHKASMTGVASNHFDASSASNSIRASGTSKPSCRYIHISPLLAAQWSKQWKAQHWSRSHGQRYYNRHSLLLFRFTFRWRGCLSRYKSCREISSVGWNVVIFAKCLTRIVPNNIRHRNQCEMVGSTLAVNSRNQGVIVIYYWCWDIETIR